ncbi:hypothetical protein F4604DRAFT_1923111 [Suillus subluteus]|nr:hypothetical protein F4604DRAFT_1923111 [Suillus subluteus]
MATAGTEWHLDKGNVGGLELLEGPCKVSDKALLKEWEALLKRVSSSTPAKKSARNDEIIELCTIKKALLMIPANKRARDNKVEVVELRATKRALTGKERATDENEDDEVVIIEPPARDGEGGGGKSFEE